MRLPLFLPLLLVAACATSPDSPGRELHRGLPVAPPPPPLRPGTGAPVVGQPGSFRQPPPRSPHQRELPPALEPGLWSGDQPQASRKQAPPVPQLFGVPLPKVPVPGGRFEQEGPARACEFVWVQALAGTGLEAKVEALEPSAKRCMVARLNETCATAFATMFDGAREEGVTVLPYRPYRAETERVAKEFARKACAGGRDTPEFRRLLEALRARLNDFLEE